MQDNKTPLELAVEEGRSKTVEYITEHLKMNTTNLNDVRMLYCNIIFVCTYMCIVLYWLGLLATITTYSYIIP